MKWGTNNFDYCICFHCARQGHKLENIKFNEKVSFCAATKADVLASKLGTDYESVIVFGWANAVTDESEKEDILLSVLNKFSEKYLAAGKNYMKKYWDETRAIRIEIKHLSGKAYQ